MRALGFGIVSGVLLSLLRAPLGLDLAQVPAVDGSASYLWRALALLAVAFGFAAAGRATVPLRMLAGAALGFAVHGLLLANVLAVGSRPALVATLLLAGALLAWLGREREDEVPSPPPPPAKAQSEASLRVARATELAGLALAGAGAALALEGVARHARLFGAALAQDDAVFAGVLLALVAGGAAAFGWIAALPRARGLSLAVGLAGSAAACYAGMRVVTGISLSQGFRDHLDRYGLDPSQQGMLATDALVAASCFVAPAFLAGLALRGADARHQVAAALAGAAAALVAIPRLLAVDPAGALGDQAVFSAELVPQGTFVAVAGAALAALAGPGRSALPRYVALGAVVVCALPALFVRVRPQPVLSPWNALPVLPYLTLDTPEGLLTVEPGAAGVKVATLDRRLVSPSQPRKAADLRRLALAVELLPPEALVRGGFEVLLVGQLTPERADALRSAGAARIDRTAAWWRSMEHLERELFEGLPLPAGEVLAPAAALARVAGGGYDLVIVAPVDGDAPRVPELELPAGTALVVWVPIDQPAWHRSLGSQVVLSGDGLEHPALGVVRNGVRPAEGSWASPLFLPAGEPSAVPTPLAWLGRSASPRLDQRSDEARAGMFARLARASSGGPHEGLLAGVELFHRSQEPSSPYEKAHEQVELPRAALERFRDAALEGPPNAYVRDLWSWLARVLAGKRWVEEVYELVEPVSARVEGVPDLEIALARADLESLDPAGARARLLPLLERASDPVEVTYLLGEAEAALGDHRAALARFERALELRPENPTLLRRRAVSAAKAGDPRARAWIEALLEEVGHEDPELRSLLGPGDPDPGHPEGGAPAPGGGSAGGS